MPLRRLAPFLLLIASCAHTPTPEPETVGDAVTSLLSSPFTRSSVDCGALQLGPIDNQMADTLADQFAQCRGQPVTIEINSPGGQVFAAIAIQKTIERHDAPVVCVVDGMAASAAFVTLQACDLRVMTNRSILMAHEAATMAAGQKNQLLNAAEVLAKINRGMTLFCAKRMGMNAEEFAARIDGGKEWWFGVEDAAKFHACDLEVASVKEAVALSHVIEKR